MADANIDVENAIELTETNINGGKESIDAIDAIDAIDTIETEPLVAENGEPSKDVKKHSSGGHGEFGQEGTATASQAVLNIFISFVGAGMLGMPYAFSQAGWLLGGVTVFVVSAFNVYCMLLLVKIRKHLESKGHTGISGYGDVGRIVAGAVGEKLVNACLVISQIGFATAYIIFIAANVNSITDGKINRATICFGCVPILAVLVQIQDMKTLSPFSLIADVSNLLGFTAVILQDYKNYQYHHEPIVAANFAHVLYIASVTLYSMEGIGLILPLESSCANREGFPVLLKKSIFGITSLMIVFGAAGYVAFGSGTLAPITLNLSGTIWSIFVKLALCLALYLTYPIMMFPINKVMEEMVLGDGSRPNRIFRAFAVLMSACVAYSIPDFGKFLGLVGASICNLLGFILPCYFHLKIFEKKDLRLWEYLLDYFLIVFGILFGILGTYDGVMNLISGESGSAHRLLLSASNMIK